MKKYVYFLLGFMLISCLSMSQPSWIQVSSSLNEDLVSVCFSDADHGWIISEQGSLTFTTDGGTTWQDQSFAGYNFTSVFFSDNSHGCIVGWQEVQLDSSLILRTNDGGNTWSAIDHAKVNRFNDVYFANNDIGWAVGSQGEQQKNSCYYTDDGGQSWFVQSSAQIVDAQLLGVSFRDELTGSVCGDNGTFFLTNNGGVISWAMGISMPLVDLNAIYNWGTLTGCIVGDEGTALYTINNWYQYIEQTSGTDEDLNAVSGDQNTNRIWAVGNNGTIIFSSSYLLGWAPQSSGVTENLNDVFILNETDGWAVGDNGTILHLTTPVDLGDPKKANAIEIFPNPVVNRLFIRLPEQKNKSSIIIYSGSGHLIYRAENIFQETSVHIKNWPAGIYIVQVTGIKDSEYLRILKK